MSFFFYKAAILAFLIFIAFDSFSQKKITKSTEVWPAYVVQLPLRSKFSIAFDYSNRYTNFFDEPTQWIARVGLNYQANKFFTYSAGYAYSEYFLSKSVRVENRPWQQLQVLNSFTAMASGSCGASMTSTCSSSPSSHTLFSTSNVWPSRLNVPLVTRCSTRAVTAPPRDCGPRRPAGDRTKRLLIRTGRRRRPVGTRVRACDPLSSWSV